MPGGSSSGLRFYGVLGAVKLKVPEHYDVSRGLPLTKESKGYCPICGYWSIKTNVVIDERTKIKGDVCLACQAVFDVSELEFIDSHLCMCGHPKDYHSYNILTCTKGKELSGCECEKYRPTEVEIRSAKKEE